MSQGIVPNHKTEERSYSLTDSLRAVASATGSPPSRDDLHAALGLPFMICVPHDDSIAPRDWPLLARDVFLVDAGRLIGLGIRDIHPPEAAIGLDHMVEFRQHFEASYRPLIARALENGQHVLAWQGWPEAEGHLWGVMDSVNDDTGELGISGSAGPTLRDGLSTAASMPLSEPPVQLYVVETTAATSPSADDLWEMVRRHARLALTNECASHLGVSTGPTAIEAWQARLSALDASDAHFSPTFEAYRACAAEFAAGLSATIRYARGTMEQLSPAIQKSLRTLTAASHKAATAFTAVAGATPASCHDDPKQTCQTVIEQLDGAKSALAEALHTFSD